MVAPGATYSLTADYPADGPGLTDIKVGEWAERWVDGVWRIRTKNKIQRFNCVMRTRLEDFWD